MSVATNLSLQTLRAEKSCLKKTCLKLYHNVNLNGHLSYAFIYGSWEIIRARKVGTTHTKVDYVVYRLFYPVILIGACLFAVISENHLIYFFSLAEAWCMLLHVFYSFIFLQNVLTNNLHRDNVKHRQKIPERLVVTDEIEKGGHKFYICKRYSILPTEKLYCTERIIWLLFNILAGLNFAIMVGSATGQILVDHERDNSWHNFQVWAMGILIVADVILTPIPMHLAHAIYPLIFLLIYDCFAVSLFHYHGIVIYRSFHESDVNKKIVNGRLIIHFLSVTLSHFILTGLSALRDYIISVLDDSRTPKQLQNLRSQKRLARRKLMNYIESADGRIIGISLEKHSYIPEHDEFIRTEKSEKLRHSYNVEDDDDDEDTDSDEEINMFRKDGRGDHITAANAQVNVQDFIPDQDMIPLHVPPKPPPPPRYNVTPIQDNDQFSSSSSSRDEMKAIQESIKRLPTPPRDEDDYNKHSSSKRQSKIPVPIPIQHKFGVVVKPRDSKENIHAKMDHPVDSPPTPPFVKLVQTLIKANKELKGEVQEQRKGKYEGKAFVKVVRANEQQEDNTLTRPNIDPAIRKHARESAKNRETGGGKTYRMDRRKQINTNDSKLEDQTQSENKTLTENKQPNKLGETRPGVERGKVVASKVIHLNSYNLPEYEEKVATEDMTAFHDELTKKLENERKKIMGIPADEQNKNKPSRGQKRRSSKKQKPLKSILKYTDHDDRNHEHWLREKNKRREQRLLKRRMERSEKGKHGQLVYDPLAVPVNVGDQNTETTTTFHYLGTKLKKDEKTVVPKTDIPLYRSHPGIYTVDIDEEKDGQPAENTKSLVAFHPLVKYFDVNEKDPSMPRHSKDKRSSKNSQKPLLNQSRLAK